MFKLLCGYDFLNYSYEFIYFECWSILERRLLIFLYEVWTNGKGRSYTIFLIIHDYKLVFVKFLSDKS